MKRRTKSLKSYYKVSKKICYLINYVKISNAHKTYMQPFYIHLDGPQGIFYIFQEMEVTSQDQDGNGPVSQNASSRGNSPGSAGVSQEGEWSHQPLVTSDGEGQILDLIVQVWNYHL